MVKNDSKKMKTIMVMIIRIILAPPVIWAYVDPGTTSVAFSALGYIFSIALFGIVFFLRPVISVIKRIFMKFTGKRELGENKDK